MIVLSWDLKTDKGQNAHRLAKLVLGEEWTDCTREFLINEICQLEKDMPRLEDLKVSILDMTPDQLRAKLHQIREDRILRKSRPKTPVQKKEAKSKVASDLDKYLASMSDEEREAFLKELEG